MSSTKKRVFPRERASGVLASKIVKDLLKEDYLGAKSKVKKQWMYLTILELSQLKNK